MSPIVCPVGKFWKKCVFVGHPTLFCWVMSKIYQLAQSQSYTLDPPVHLYFFQPSSTAYYIILYKLQRQWIATSPTTPPLHINTTHNTKIFFIKNNLCLPPVWPFVKNLAPTCSPQNSCCRCHCSHPRGNLSTSSRDAASCLRRRWAAAGTWGGQTMRHHCGNCPAIIPGFCGVLEHLCYGGLGNHGVGKGQYSASHWIWAIF